MIDANHPELELQDLVEGLLGPAEHATIQAHVDGCVRCRAELDELRRGRELARLVPRLTAPGDVRRDVAVCLQRASDAEQQNGRGVPRRRILAYVLGAAAAVAIAAYVSRREDVPASAIRSYEASKAGERAFDIVTSDPAVLERFFSGRVSFNVRVFDLGMMGYRLVGGRVDQIFTHPIALYTYSGPDNRTLTCGMYRGDLSELPEPNERRDHNDITFLVYKRGAVTAVFWREGDVVCVAMSDMPTDEVVALAFAKSIRS
ncbi:MAG: zf-HC2 domain-containing protein [Acidobacteria bacterium]|nr:zf-HC2 domain-containing protein [Acidobacteriota bacterium]